MSEELRRQQRPKQPRVSPSRSPSLGGRDRCDHTHNCEITVVERAAEGFNVLLDKNEQLEQVAVEL